MPPPPPPPTTTSSVRKTSLATDSNRRQSGRQARTSASKPINYYARPYGSMGVVVDEPQDQDPPGFFPAITYFADTITALPKETQRHVSLMKEVEAKVHGPTEALKALSTKILQLPAPPRRAHQLSSQGLLSFTASNSATGSLNGSVVNGSAPNLVQRISDVLDTSDAHTDEQADLVRRNHFQELRHLIGTMIVNLDEKNNVMAEANRVLSQQLSRMDSVMPHVENEISEEARLGSSTHWAYADNRIKKQNPPVTERARRDVAATTNLAAAAAAVHDSDIAAARGQATREAKKGRAHHVDSDFDERPPTKRAVPAKGRKEVLEQKVAGLGILNAPGALAPAKRRKVEKAAAAAAAAAAPAMERSLSSAHKNGKPGNTTPRSTPAIAAAEPVKQRKKPGPAPGTVPKKRNQAANSGANSPAVASSPVLAILQPEVSAQRPASSRVRQNSSTSNLQYTLLAGEGSKVSSRPVSVAENRSVNGTNGAAQSHEAKEKKDANVAEEEDKMDVDRDVKQHRINDLKNNNNNNNMAVPDASALNEPLRGRTSKVSTPITPVLPSEGGTSMSRTRSNRGNNGHTSHPNNTSNNNTASSSSSRPSQSHTPENGSSSSGRRNGHRKSGSGAHILKQIASFNRSPDMDRHRSVPGEIASDQDSDAEGAAGANFRSSSRRSATRGMSTVVRTSRTSRRAETESRSAQQSRSRNQTPEEDDMAVPEVYEAPEPEQPVEVVVAQEPQRDTRSAGRAAAAAREEPEEEVEEEEEEEEEEDPNEPKYCYCGQGSYGEMIACDNPNCSMEWFHLQCTGLRNVPGDNDKWYCDVCKEQMAHSGRGGKKGRPGSRHAGR